MYKVSKIEKYLQNLRGTQRIFFVVVSVICLAMTSKFITQLHLLENPFGVYSLKKVDGYQRIFYDHILDHYAERYKSQFVEEILQNGVLEEGTVNPEIVFYKGIGYRFYKYGGFSTYQINEGIGFLRFMLLNAEVRDELIAEHEAKTEGSYVNYLGILAYPTYNGNTPHIFSERRSNSKPYRYPYSNPGEGLMNNIFPSSFIKDKYLSLSSYTPRNVSISDSHLDESNRQKKDNYLTDLNRLSYLMRRDEKIRKLIGSINLGDQRNFAKPSWLADQYELLEKDDSALSGKFSEYRRNVRSGFYEAYFEAVWECLVLPILAILALITFIPHYTTRILAFIADHLIGWFKAGFDKEEP